VDFRPFEEVRAARIFQVAFNEDSACLASLQYTLTRLWLGSQPRVAAVAVAAV
jgi:hypothetical protein